MGDSFTIADAYPFAWTGWGTAAWMKSVYSANIDLNHERIRDRLTVQRVLREDGLLAN